MDTPTTQALINRYRATSTLLARPWQSDEVRNAVAALALLVRNYAFGPDAPAIDAAHFLASCEPLEQLAPDSLPVAKMRIMACYYRREYQEALAILEPLLVEHPDDAFLQRGQRIIREAE